MPLTNYTFPTARQIGIIVKGLKPSTEHRISVNGRDFGSYAAPGRIPSGFAETAENVQLDGFLTQPIFSDTNGTLFAVLIVPGVEVGIGLNTIGVTDKNVAVTSDFQSQSYGNFRVLFGENPPLPPPQAPLPPDPVVPAVCNDPDATNFGGPGECIYGPAPTQEEGPSADFVWSGRTTEITTTANISFTSVINVGLPLVAGAPVRPVETYSWVFGGIGVTAVPSANSAQNPAGIKFSFEGLEATATATLTVASGNGAFTSTVTKNIPLYKQVTAAPVPVTEPVIIFDSPPDIITTFWTKEDVEYDAKFGQTVTYSNIETGQLGTFTYGEINGTNFSTQSSLIPTKEESVTGLVSPDAFFSFDEL
jgi:hypothetical protein